ncbi:MAG: gfo/Idh/MocA family oxidoreductase [Luteitalea sp.]|nr:gfo/Idh/MocA family oxidoreductase [Luteitalea sp.]
MRQVTRSCTERGFTRLGYNRRMSSADSRPFRWGILGTARIVRRLVEPLRSQGHALVAVASRDRGRAEAFARDWQIPRAHGAYDDLLADPDVDAVYIPLPNALHAAWTINAAAAGKHVLCEKPLALTVGEVEAMGEAAARHGVVVAEAFMYRHHPVTLAARQLVLEGAVGSVRHLRGAFTFLLTGDHNVRLDPRLGGGGLWDIGCYPVSWMRYVLGADPLEVSATIVTGSTGVDVAAAATLRFPGDILGQFDCGFTAPFRTEMQVVGSEGVLDVPHPFKPGPTEVIVVRRGDETTEVPIEGGPLYQLQVDDLRRAARESVPARVLPSESRGNVATLVALYESARTGRVIGVQDSGIGKREPGTKNQE